MYVYIYVCACVLFVCVLCMCVYVCVRVFVKDETKAFEYYKESAEKGYVHAQFRLAECYKLGIGIEKDLEKAIYWYNKMETN